MPESRMASARRAMGIVRCYRNGDQDGIQRLLVDCSSDGEAIVQTMNALAQMVNVVLDAVCDDPDGWLSKHAVEIALEPD